MHGFLGWGGTPDADLNLVTQLAIGVLLVMGMFLARARQIQLHRACQTMAIVASMGFVSAIMIPSFKKQVWPHLPAKIGEPFYSWATAHAVVGTVATLLALYVLFSAGTNFLPLKLRFTNYKLWMRSLLVIWWLAILLGVGTYRNWYVVGEKPAIAAETTGNPFTITLTNFKFTPERLTVPVGSTVDWVTSGGRHTVEADDGSFKSDTLVAGGKFSHKFEKPGNFLYFCGNHGAKGGKAMSGVVVVSR